MNEEISDQDILDQVAGYEASVPSIRAAEEAHQAAVEDLQEAAFAAMRQLLEEAKRLPSIEAAAQHATSVEAATRAETERDGILASITGALAGPPGRIFLEHMHRLERESAALRQAIGHLRYCAHGCATACPHTKLYLRELDGLTLQGVTWQLHASARGDGG